MSVILQWNVVIGVIMQIISSFFAEKDDAAAGNVL